jgi:hypothetical protein
VRGWGWGGVGVLGGKTFWCGRKAASERREAGTAVWNADQQENCCVAAADSQDLSMANVTSFFELPNRRKRFL